MTGRDSFRRVGKLIAWGGSLVLVVLVVAVLAFFRRDSGSEAVVPPTTLDQVSVPSEQVNPPSVSGTISSTGAPTTTHQRAASPTVATALPAPTTTMAPSEEPDGIRIVAVGDIACDPSSSSFEGGLGTDSSCQQQATSDLVVDAGYAAFLGLGDLQYEDGTDQAFMASYDPSWGRVKDITFPVPGNHEYHTSHASGYYSYFGSSAGDPDEGYYSYDIGDWHLVALNSNCDVVSCSEGSPQESWLRTDLATNSKRCALVYWHHPLYSSGKHGNNPEVAPLYRAAYEFGVEVAIAGHDHHYERFAPQDASGNLDPAAGIREFVVGSGGKSHYAVEQAMTNSEALDSETFGVLELTLLPERYEWRFVPRDGRLYTDSGADTCH